MTPPVNILVDSNILLRTAEPAHPMYPLALGATNVLRQRGHTICIVPQCVYEFWVVATRPTVVNGLGFTPAQADAEVVKLLNFFTFLPDAANIFPGWRTLVQTHAVIGKNAHDARLVAAMQVHSVTHLLTFNDQDFRRFPTITVLTPAAVLANPSIP